MLSRVLQIAAAVTFLLTCWLPTAAQAGSLESTVKYLQMAQQKDGGFAINTKTTSSDFSTSLWVALGLSSVGINPADQPRKGRTLLAYLEDNARKAQSIEEISRLIIVATAAKQNPRAFGKRNLIAELSASQDPSGYLDNGSDRTAGTAWAIVAASHIKGDPQLKSLQETGAKWLLGSGKNWAQTKGANAAPSVSSIVMQAIALTYKNDPTGNLFIEASRDVSKRASQQQGKRNLAISAAMAIQASLATGSRTKSDLTASSDLKRLTSIQGDGSFGDDTVTAARALPGLNGTKYPLYPISESKFASLLNGPPVKEKPEPKKEPAKSTGTERNAGTQTGQGAPSPGVQNGTSNQASSLLADARADSAGQPQMTSDETDLSPVADNRTKNTASTTPEVQGAILSGATDPIETQTQNPGLQKSSEGEASKPNLAAWLGGSGALLLVLTGAITEARSFTRARKNPISRNYETSL